MKSPAGNMGRALAMHKAFCRKGFSICVIFDSNPRLHRRKVGSLRIHPMDRLAQVVKTKKVRLAIMALPSPSAQDVANRLVRAGIKGYAESFMLRLVRA